MSRKPKQVAQVVCQQVQEHAYGKKVQQALTAGQPRRRHRGAVWSLMTVVGLFIGLAITAIMLPGCSQAPQIAKNTQEPIFMASAPSPTEPQPTPSAVPTYISASPAKETIYKVMVLTMTNLEAQNWAGADRNMIWSPEIEGASANEQLIVELIIPSLHGDQGFAFAFEADMGLNVDDYYFLGLLTSTGCYNMPVFVIYGVAYLDPDGHQAVGQLLNPVYIENAIPPHKPWAECPGSVDPRWQDPLPLSPDKGPTY